MKAIAAITVIGLLFAPTHALAWTWTVETRVTTLLERDGQGRLVKVAKPRTRLITKDYSTPGIYPLAGPSGWECSLEIQAIEHVGTAAPDTFNQNVMILCSQGGSLTSVSAIASMGSGNVGQLATGALGCILGLDSEGVGYSFNIAPH